MNLSGQAWNELSENARRILAHFGHTVEIAWKDESYLACSKTLSPELTVGAWAQRNGIDTAGFTFNAGMAFALEMYCRRCSHNQIFTRSTTAAGIDEERPRGRRSFLRLLVVARNGGGTAPQFVPNIALHDEGRYKLGDLLAEMAIHFVVLHEYAHYFLGHLEYLGGDDQGFAMAQVPKNLPNAQDAATLRALETEADMFAVSKLLHSGRTLVRQGDGPTRKYAH
jgi:hypothetical protein